MNDSPTTHLEERPHDQLSEDLRRHTGAFRDAGGFSGADLRDVHRRSQRQRSTRLATVAVAAVVVLGAGVLTTGRLGSTTTGLETGVQPDAPPATGAATPGPSTTIAPVPSPAGTTPTSDAPVPTSSPAPIPSSTLAPGAPQSLPQEPVVTTMPASSPLRLGAKPILRGDGVGDARFGDRYADVLPKLVAVLGPEDPTSGAPEGAERTFVSWGTFGLVFEPVDGELVLRSWFVGVGDGPNLVDVRTAQDVGVGDLQADALARMPGEPTRRPRVAGSPDLDYCYADGSGEICIWAPDATNPADSYVLGLHAGPQPF